MKARFLHTSDWQLGVTRQFLSADSQARWAEARFEAIRNLGRIAKEELCEFIVVAGDVFESNQVDRKTILKACEAMAGEAFWLGGKRSKIVVTNIHPVGEASIAIPAVFLTVFEKQLIGSLFGSANPRRDIPKLLELYSQGQLDLDGLVTRTYSLDDINQGLDRLATGAAMRDVIVF